MGREANHGTFCSSHSQHRLLIHGQPWLHSSLQRRMCRLIACGHFLSPRFPRLIALYHAPSGTWLVSWRWRWNVCFCDFLGFWILLKHSTVLWKQRNFSTRHVAASKQERLGDQFRDLVCCCRPDCRLYKSRQRCPKAAAFSGMTA